MHQRHIDGGHRMRSQRCIDGGSKRCSGWCIDCLCGIDVKLLPLARKSASSRGRLRAVNVRTEAHQVAVAIDDPAVHTEGQWEENSGSATSRFKIGPFQLSARTALALLVAHRKRCAPGRHGGPWRSMMRCAATLRACRSLPGHDLAVVRHTTTVSNVHGCSSGPPVFGAPQVIDAAHQKKGAPRLHSNL
jgi:hypothetical protein